MVKRGVYRAHGIVRTRRSRSRRIRKGGKRSRRLGKRSRRLGKHRLTYSKRKSGGGLGFFTRKKEGPREIGGPTNVTANNPHYSRKLVNNPLAPYSNDVKIRIEQELLDEQAQRQQEQRRKEAEKLVQKLRSEASKEAEE